MGNQAAIKREIKERPTDVQNRLDAPSEVLKIRGTSIER
jgi:hypothetical protein